MNKHIILSGQRLNLEQLQQARILLEPGSEIRAIYDFLIDYLGPDETINVKTSGTTGTPKVISLQKIYMRNSAWMTGNYFGLAAQMSALLCLPVQYIAGKMMLVRAVELELNLSIVKPGLNPLLSLPEEPFNFAAMVPAQVEQSILNPITHRKFEKIKSVIIGGGIVLPRLLNPLQTVSNQCFATYGMTETITHVAVQRLNGEAKSSEFQALPGVQISQDARGCLTLKAHHLTATEIITNDLVELVGVDRFRWRGRVDNVINTGGIKVIPEEVEAKLRNKLDRRFFIIGQESTQWGQQISLVVEGEPFDPQTLEMFNEILQHCLEKYERPKAILFVKEFVETTSGKIQRKATLEARLLQDNV